MRDSASDFKQIELWSYEPMFVFISINVLIAIQFSDWMIKDLESQLKCRLKSIEVFNRHSIFRLALIEVLDRNSIFHSNWSTFDYLVIRFSWIEILSGRLLIIVLFA